MRMLQRIRHRVSTLARRVILGTTSAVFIGLYIFSTRNVYEIPRSVIEHHAIKQSGGLYRIPNSSPLSINLVVAATMTEDYSWVKELRIPGLTVIPYIADNTSAPHHAQQNKGHEAMMYHQYFYDFYDNLPDISVLIHSQQLSWHVDQLLDQSMIFSLNHMDMREVQRRQFLNLRVTWGIGCATGRINTTKVNEESGNIPEQKEMQEAFRANFNIYHIPEILATPCCSQIAVTKELIQSVPRNQYQNHIQWLLNTNLPDNISGRTWEHMWQYLFLHKSVDCPIEHKAYCRLYHICFGGREEYDEWIELNQGRSKLEDELKNLLKKEEERQSEEQDKEEKGQANKDGNRVDKNEQGNQGTSRKEVEAKANAKMREWLETELETVKETIRVRKEVAIVRGSVEANRIAEGDDLYGEYLEPGLDLNATET